MKKIRTYLIASVALLLCCCSATTMLNQGTENEVEKGDKFQVKMASNPTTGYSWRWVNRDNQNVDSVAQEYKQDKAPKMMMGVGGNETWTFSATKSGSTTLVFCYEQPWNPGENTDTLVYKINIK